MKIKLPNKKEHPENIEIDASKVVVIGANGSGKTSVAYLKIYDIILPI